MANMSVPLSDPSQVGVNSTQSYIPRLCPIPLLSTRVQIEYCSALGPYCESRRRDCRVKMFVYTVEYIMRVEYNKIRIRYGEHVPMYSLIRNALREYKCVSM